MKQTIYYFSALMLVFSLFTNCGAKEGNKSPELSASDSSQLAQSDTAYFASGCFWCTEAVFERVQGVLLAESGYSGGSEPDPTYQKVSAGLTEHAESVRVIYNPGVITYEELVEIFFGSHDPTQLNRQGPDIGKQYRSAIFYTNNQEKEVAENVKEKASANYEDSIVTEITKFSAFYKAEAYHQAYYEQHQNDPYIKSVSKPKVEKFMKEFRDKLKEEYR